MASCIMATVTVDDPEAYKTGNIDTNGKVHVSKDLAGKKAKIIIETIEDCAE